YAPGPAGVTARHSHEEYQFCLSFNTPGSYNYRGARHLVPKRSLSVLHSGEMHSAQDLEARAERAQFWMIYVPPAVMRLAAQRLSHRRSNNAPLVAKPVHLDSSIFNAFVSFHELMRKGTAALEHDSQVLDIFACFLARTGAVREQPSAGVGREPQAVRRARDYLRAYFSANKSLNELASVAGLSPQRLNRVFRQTLWLPPHAYQTQLRVERAKSLILQRLPLAQVAAQCGFYDQSHLNAHFKRLVSVTPGRYLPQAARRQEPPRQRA
ncbi:MAG: AraC family transcriptional regulator, partial [Verrucomicrobiota bacterium]|nr:AraC family transcriptional regulator [Verrucomicrobiota bacterium]